MSLTQTERIYFVDDTTEDAAGKYVGCTFEREIDIPQDILTALQHDPKQPVKAHNLRTGDLAITLSLLHDDGKERVIRYLVSSVVGSEGLLVPGDVAEKRPDEWATAYLRYIIGELAPGEFEQFTLPAFASYVRQKNS